MTDQGKPQQGIDRVAINQEYARVHERLNDSVMLFRNLIRVAEPDPRLEPIRHRLKRIENLFDKIDSASHREAEQFLAGPKTAERYTRFEQKAYRYVRFRTAVAKAQLALEPEARTILYDYERVSYSAHANQRPALKTPDREQER